MEPESSTITSMTRTQIQIDVSKELRQQIKIVAISKGMTMREFILDCVEKQHPEIKVPKAKPVTHQ